MDQLTRDYQIHLLSQMLDRQFLIEAVKYLKPEHFDQDLAPAVNTILKTYRKHGTPPTRPQLRQMLKGVSVPGSNGKVIDIDVSEVKQFSKFRSLRSALLRGIENLSSGDMDGAVHEITMELRHTSKHELDDTFDLFDEHRDPVREGPVFMGLLGVDADTAGVCRGEAASVMAVTNGGKSTLLVHIGALAAEAGLDVFHASLEMPRGAMRQKYFNRLEYKPPKKGKIKAPDKLGKIHVFCSPPGAARIFDIRARIEQLDFEPHLVIIDSVDNVRSARNFGGERWPEEESVAQDFKAMMSDFNCCGYTSFQANRPGYGRELIKPEHVKGSLDKCRLMDQIFSVNQDDNEMILDDKTGEVLGRVYVAKNRYGPRGRIEKIVINWADCTFKSIEEVPYA